MPDFIQKIKNPEIAELMDCLHDFMLDNEWGEDGEAEQDLLKIISYFQSK